LGDGFYYLAKVYWQGAFISGFKRWENIAAIGLFAKGWGNGALV